MQNAILQKAARLINTRKPSVPERILQILRRQGLAFPGITLMRECVRRGRRPSERLPPASDVGNAGSASP